MQPWSMRFVSDDQVRLEVSSSLEHGLTDCGLSSGAFRHRPDFFDPRNRLNRHLQHIRFRLAQTLGVS
ncbi:hypothetical protein CFN79_03250 [Chromobacterium vaccinii]|nr:hypothetical protein CFN79_03250 [Chromobacterium vaccinii]